MNIFSQTEYWEPISAELKEAVAIIFSLLPEGAYPMDQLDSLAVLCDCSEFEVQQNQNYQHYLPDSKLDLGPGRMMIKPLAQVF